MAPDKNHSSSDAQVHVTYKLAWEQKHEDLGRVLGRQRGRALGISKALYNLFTQKFSSNASRCRSSGVHKRGKAKGRPLGLYKEVRIQSKQMSV